MVFAKAQTTRTAALQALRIKLKKSTAPVLSSTFDSWLSHLIANALPKELASPKSIAAYTSLQSAHVKGTPLATTRLGDITPELVRDWLHNLHHWIPCPDSPPQPPNPKPQTPMIRVPLSAASKARYLQCVKAALNRVDAPGWTSPAGKVPNPRIPETVKPFLEKDDWPAFLELFPERYRLMVKLARHGLRRGEICAAKREDLEGQGIWVRRSIGEDAKGRAYVKPTKSDRVRWVALTADVAAEIKTKPPGWLFPANTKPQPLNPKSNPDPKPQPPNPKPIRPRNFARAWDIALAKSKFKGIGRHDLRSSFATWMLQSGTDTRTAADQLGHSEKMLTKIYARSNNASKLNALDLTFGTPDAKPKRSKTKAS